jgi:ribosomal protein L36
VYGIERRNVAYVWCGVMPRVGSKQHMRYCPDCRAVKRRYWKLVDSQGSPSRD